VPLAQASFDLGDAANFAIYSSGGTTSDQLSPGPLTVNGNVGVGQAVIYPSRADKTW
jgi:hypothetical protein